MSVTAPNTGRELTEDEVQERAKLCYDLETEIKQDIGKGREALWDLAHHLYDFNEQEGWSALGHGSQEEWLAQPEIGIPRVQYFRAVRKWKIMVVNRQVPMDRLLELDPSKLDIVLPLIAKNSVPLEKLLNAVETMGARDLREEYIGSRDEGEDNPPAGDDDDGVIEGKVSDEKPVQSEEPNDKLAQAAGAVDSWLEMGGDRRKAVRNWGKFQDQHPVFLAVKNIQKLMDGDEDAPDRVEARSDWLFLVGALNVTLPTE